MPAISTNFDLDSVEWRRATDPSCTEYTIDIEYSLLGYDMDSGRLDMLLRLPPGGHCRPHRHVAATATLVLEGDQFVTDLLPDGPGETVHRTKGTYALSAADGHPHDEYGGENGTTVLLSMSAPDGVLFEYFSRDGQGSWTLSIAEYVQAWNDGAVHGAAPAAAAE